MKNLSAQQLVQMQAAALEAAANPIVISGKDGIIIWVNNAFEELSGYRRDEAIGQSSNLLKSGHQSSAFYKEIWDTILSGQKWHGELSNRRKDGSFYQGELTITPIKNEMGEITHFIAIELDVTRRKRAEDRLHLLAQAVENSSELIAITDSQGYILVVNQALVCATGYRESEILGQLMGSALISPNNPPNLDAEILASTLSTGAWKGECLTRRKDGTDFPTLLSAGQIKDGQGVMIGLYGISRDITGRKLAESELRQSKERLEIAVEVADIGLWELDLKGRAVTTSLRHDQIFGYQSLQGWNTEKFFAHVLPEERAKVEEQFADSLVSGTLDSESRIRTADGEVRWMWARGRRLLDELGQPSRMSGTIIDITERKQLEAQLRQAQKMEAVGQIAGGVAHDFNNLLGVIMGNMELMSERVPPDQIFQNYLEKVRMAVRSATGVTRQLLAFSRKQILQPVVLDLNDAIQQLNKMTYRLFGENIEVVLSLEPALGFVKADPGQIEQVLMNLLVNARDAMPEGGKVLIRTSSVELDREFEKRHIGAKLGHYKKLTLSDSGVGMKKEVLDRIFEPFFTTKAIAKGTGLGLATVYGIVKQSGGYIFAESSPGSGTTFDIYLPRVDSKPIADGLSTSSPILWGSETILLVEDEQLLREVTRVQLEKLGYQVYEAGNARQAMFLFDEHVTEISLLLTDLIMPGVNGRILGDKLKEKKPDLRILFMSGYTDEEVFRDGVSDHRQFVLTKPFTGEALAFRLREILEERPQIPVA